MNKPVKHSPGMEAVDAFLASVEPRAFRMAELASKNTVDAMDIVERAVTHWVKKSMLFGQDEWRGQFFAILCQTITDFDHREIAVRRRLNPRHETVCLQDVDPSDKGLSMIEAGQARLNAGMVAAISHLALPQQQVLLLQDWLGFPAELIARLLVQAPLIIENRYKSAVMGLREAFVEDHLDHVRSMTDEELLQYFRRVLDASARDVSYAQQYQLRQIRLQALKQLQPRPIFQWILVTGLMGLCLFVFWWLNLPRPGT